MKNLSDQKEDVVQRYVDIMTNAGFKALFGDMNNKEAVMSIINAFLPEHRKVIDIEYLPTDHQGPMVDVSKEFQYDFMCRDGSGTVFIVEMQKYDEEHWFKRCVSYASRAYDRQNRKGEGYDVPPVYLIGLMGIDIHHENPELWEGRYVSEYTFREKISNELLDETIVIIFAELSRFHKAKKNDCITEQDKMLYVLKNMGNLMNQPSWLRNEIYTRIFDACEIGGFDEDKRINYDKDMNDERRQKGIYAAFKKKGFECGLKEGREIGVKAGREEGREEGRVEGVMTVAREMKRMGMELETIAKATGLDLKVIEGL